MIDKYAFDRTLDEIYRSIRGLAASGNPGFDCAAQSLEKLECWGQGTEDFPDTLETVRADLGDCQRCQLAGGRKNIVFGDGNLQAKLVFVKERINKGDIRNTMGDDCNLIFGNLICVHQNCAGYLAHHNQPFR